MKKVLFCASTLSHLVNFHLPYLKDFRDGGYQVWTAAGGGKARFIPYADRQVELPLCKKFFSPRNVLAIFRVRRLLLQEGFECISTHTTLASAVVRAAVLLLPRKRRPKVYCICHGYLFGERGGWKKWAYLLPEKLCAPVTDVLMVMNREDYRIAEKHRLTKGRLVFIHGMGLDAGQFPILTPEERETGRRELGFGPDDFLFVYAAEFSRRKNQPLLLRAFAKALPRFPRGRLVLAGSGATLEECRALAKQLGIGEQVRFLGYVEEMERLYPLCDAAVSSSRIEGLPFNIMEAMACGLPVIASRVKGHTDLLGEENPWLFSGEDELAELLARAGELHPTDWGERLEPYLLPAVREELRREYGTQRPPEA